MPRYCFLLSIVSGDARNALLATCTDVANYAIGRDDDGAGGFNRYVLGVAGVAATAGTDPGTGLPVEVGAAGFIGYNQDVPANVVNALNAIQQRANLVRQVAFNPPKTRAEIVAYLRRLAGEDGCDKGLVLAPGNTVGAADGAALLAKFTPLA
jgi:hypothetical protein